MPESFSKQKLTPNLDAKPWFDLTKYQQVEFDRGKPKWFILLWWTIEGLIFPLTPHNFYGLRRNLLRLFGAKIGKGVLIRPTVRVSYPWKVEIGDYSWVGDEVYFYSLDRISVGSHTIISQCTYLCTGTHNFNDSHFQLVTSPINIGNGAWVASHCFIGLGVNIGANSVIGARSTVLQDIPEEVVAWGSPCKPKHPRIRPDNFLPNQQK